MLLHRSPTEVRDPYTGRVTKVILSEYRVFLDYAEEHDGVEFGYYFASVQQYLYNWAADHVEAESVRPFVSY